MLSIAHIDHINLHLLGQLHDLDAGPDQSRAGLHRPKSAVANSQGDDFSAGSHAILVCLFWEVTGRYRRYMGAVGC